MSYMVIGVCGYGYTGSGALLDLFREYGDFSQCPYDDVEFMMPYYPDGLESLAYNLFKNPSRFMSSDVSMYRFERFMNQYARSSKVVNLCTHGRLPDITNNFLSKIVDISWQGSWLFDFYQVQESKWGWFKSRALRTIRRKFEKYNIDLQIEKKRNMRISIDEEKFYLAAKEFVNEIIDEMHPVKHERVILNQPFAANYPTKSFAFFDNAKAIIVDRDPRDVYILSKRAVKSRSEWIPTDDVRMFIKYYKYMHKHLKEDSQDDDVVIVNFEDIIFNTEEVISKIETMIGPLGQKNGETHFRPEISINNTQLYKKYPEYLDDVNLIEKELKEYLYDFSNKPTPDFSTETF